MLDILWLGKIAAEFKLTSICAYFKAIEYGCVCVYVLGFCHFGWMACLSVRMSPLAGQGACGVIATCLHKYCLR